MLTLCADCHCALVHTCTLYVPRIPVLPVGWCTTVPWGLLWLQFVMLSRLRDWSVVPFLVAFRVIHLSRFCSAAVCLPSCLTFSALFTHACPVVSVVNSVHASSAARGDVRAFHSVSRMSHTHVELLVSDVHLNSASVSSVCSITIAAVRNVGACSTC